MLCLFSARYMEGKVVAYYYGFLDLDKTTEKPKEKQWIGSNASDCADIMKLA